MPDDKEDPEIDGAPPGNLPEEIGPSALSNIVPSQFMGTSRQTAVPPQVRQQAFNLNLGIGNVPPEIAMLANLPPDALKQVLTDSSAFAQKQLAIQERHLDKTFEAEEKDKARSHSKWQHLYWFLGLFVLVAIAGIVALYVTGKDAAAEKLGLALLSFAGGVLAGAGWKGAKEKADE